MVNSQTHFRLSVLLVLALLGASPPACEGPTPGTTSHGTGGAGAPTVAATIPANGATDVSTSSALTATFSELVDPATVTTATFTLSPAVGGTVSLVDTTATFTLSAPLTGTTTYTATLTTGIKDLSGIPMAIPRTWTFTTGATPDTTRPTVGATTPAQGATNVSTSSALTATFSEPIDPLTVTTTTFTLRNSANVPVTGNITTNGVTLTFAPAPGSPLTFGTAYTATLTTGIKDLADNALAAPFSWTFTTGTAPDTTPPTVSATSPTSSATNVSTSSGLTATFSEPINPATVTAATFTLKDGANNPVIGNITTSGVTVTFALTSGTPLTFGAAYTATLTTGIKDLAGNALSSPFTWNFTTQTAPDTTSPTVNATTPSNNATNVSTSASLASTFSEPMNASTISTSTFTLRDSGNNPVTGAVFYNGTTATFTPATPLLTTSTYTATLTTGIKDLAGNPLTANFTWGFTTAAGATSTLGLEFPRNDQVADGNTVRFKFTNPHLNGLPIYGPGGNGVTYIFKVRPKQHTGYYTTFFWGNDDGVGFIDTFTWHNGGADTYYGMHPYPQGQTGSNGTVHNWEISADTLDIQNGLAVKDAWYTQAVRVWSDGSGKHHEFYWDWPNTDAAHKVVHTSPSNLNNLNPPFPALTFGDAPWAPGQELCSCTLRGIQIYSSLLSLADIQSELAAPQSTVAGANSIWYLNANPTPTDISDKSGKGHHPAWVGNLRPTLYVGP